MPVFVSSGVTWAAMLFALLFNISDIHLAVCIKDFFLYALVPFFHQTYTQAALNCVFEYPHVLRYFVLNSHWIK